MVDLEKLLTIVDEVIRDQEYEVITWDNLGEDPWALCLRFKAEDKLNKLLEHRKILEKEIKQQKRRKKTA